MKILCYCVSSEAQKIFSTTPKKAGPGCSNDRTGLFQKSWLIFVRLIHRLKYYNNANFLYKTYPVKLLESFKEKWKYLIRKLGNVPKRKRHSRRKKIKNYLKIRVSMRTFENYERRYTTKLVDKRLFYLMYQRSVDSKYLSKVNLNTKAKKQDDLMQFKLIKPHFRLDVIA